MSRTSKHRIAPHERPSSQDARVVSLGDFRKSRQAYDAARALIADDLKDLGLLLHGTAYRLARHGHWRGRPAEFVETRAREGRLDACGDPLVAALLDLRTHVEDVLAHLSDPPE